jgi:glycosyltransferase involved in cell wall biosynthesis
VEARPLAVVVPAWNEAETIAAVVRGALSHGQVVVVDDCSKDATAEVAMAAGAVVVKHAANLGYDGALNSGFATALGLGATWIVTMDADGSHDPSAISALGETLWSGAAVVVGRRGFRERISESIFGLWTGWRWSISDPLSGMKAYRADLLERFGCFDRYGSIGTDLLLRAAAAGLEVRQIPVPYRKRDGQPRFGRAWRANLRILRALVQGILHAHKESHP